MLAERLQHKTDRWQRSRRQFIVGCRWIDLEQLIDRLNAHTRLSVNNSSNTLTGQGLLISVDLCYMLRVCDDVKCIPCDCDGKGTPGFAKALTKPESS